MTGTSNTDINPELATEVVGDTLIAACDWDAGDEDDVFKGAMADFVDQAKSGEIKPGKYFVTGPDPAESQQIPAEYVFVVEQDGSVSTYDYI